MHEKEKKQLNSFSLTSSAILIVVIITLTILFLLPHRDLYLVNEDVNYIEHFTYSDGTKAKIWNFKTAGSDTIDIYCDLPALDQPRLLVFQTKYTYVKVFTNGNEIYADSILGNNDIGSSNGICWRKINLPPSDEPVTLMLTCTPAYSDNKCIINHFYIGSASACVFNVVYEHLPATVIGTVFMIIGFLSICLFLYYYLRYRSGHDFLFIGVATFITALWMIFDTGMLPFVWGNEEILQILSSVNLLLVPLSIGFICSYRLTGRLKLISNIYTLCCELNAVISCLLYILFVADFYYSRWSTIFLNILGVPLLCFLIFTYKIGDKKYKNIPAYITILCTVTACTLMLIMRYRHGFIHDSSYLIRTSIICYQLCLIIYHAKITAVEYREKYENKIRHEYEITDRVTGYYNRTALNEYRDKYENKLGKSTCGIAFFSLSHIKQVNEAYGYEAGTKYIQSFTSGLHSSFPDNCDFYRIGSKKFFVVIPGNDPEDTYVDGRTALELFCSESNEFREHRYKMTYKTSFVYDANCSIYDLMEIAESRI